jgi:hypothetical protein
MTAGLNGADGSPGSPGNTGLAGDRGADGTSGADDEFSVYQTADEYTEWHAKYEAAIAE